MARNPTITERMATLEVRMDHIEKAVAPLLTMPTEMALQTKMLGTLVTQHEVAESKRALIQESLNALVNELNTKKAVWKSQRVLIGGLFGGSVALSTWWTDFWRPLMLFFGWGK